MVQTCTKCSRANPADAAYCYFDGFVLGHHGRNGGPVAVAAQTFASPLVFPTGRACRSFNELALACQEEWATARDLLQQGYLEKFLGGIGRFDLALAAKEAARFPDPDRGLDQLLAKLPADVLDEPKLRVEPAEVNLGVVPAGEDRQFVLHLENQGMRLLYGSAGSEAAWLTLGDGTGAPEKHFQFGHETSIPVHVRGDRLRAGAKPLEATLAVESNGGTAAVAVRVEVPIKPFPPGVLGGAKSPRQVAEKAKANPKGAAALFEQGAVAEWYKSNGWTYPVQGPSASGVGAVQQFFEALGLTAPPKVEISERKVSLQGEVGQPLRHTLQVSSQEKRPVYAHATSNQPWLEVGRAKLNGRHAVITLAVPAVPNRPGETLTAKVLVQSNGNQRFVVPVTLQVGESFDFAAPAPVLVTEEAPELDAVTAAVPAPALKLEAPPRRSGVRRKLRSGTPLWVHALPALLLLLALAGAAVWDAVGPKKQAGGGGDQIDPNTVSWSYDVDDPEPRLRIEFSDRQRFGIQMEKEDDPLDRGKKKRLTFKTDGGSNNTCVRVDGSDFLFGQAPGYWERGKARVALPDRKAWQSVMIFPEGRIKVTQHVEIVPGEQSHLLDTCLVYYTVENTSDHKHKVGLRFLLDTFIGSSDGVPFVIPETKGKSELLTTKRDFSEKEIPDYLLVLEKPDLKKPGTVVTLTLKGINLPNTQLEPPHRMLICRWDSGEIRWQPDEEQQQPIGGKDSCVYIYWSERTMAPHEKRHMAFTYGLGKIAVEGANNNLGLSVGGSLRPGGDFTVTALVKSPHDGQKVKLILPPGLKFAKGEDAVKDVAAGGDYNQVSWHVHAGDEEKTYTIQATSEGSRASVKVKIRAGGIFSSK